MKKIEYIEKTNTLIGTKGLVKIQNGLWQVSPNIMMKGNEKKQLLLSYFNTDESINKTCGN